MKLWHCDWVPSAVADWLCAELDAKGIPGTTYTHTLFSLLHPYFCPHPVPEDPSSLQSRKLREIELGSIRKFRDIDISDELEVPVHPDADFPDLEIVSTLEEGNCKSKKHKKKLQQLHKSPEKAWKAAALECLGFSSDESYKQLIDELFVRLQNKRDPKLQADLATLSPCVDQHSKTFLLRDFLPSFGACDKNNFKKKSDLPLVPELTQKLTIKGSAELPFSTIKETEIKDGINHCQVTKEVLKRKRNIKLSEMELGFNLHDGSLRETLSAERENNGNESLEGSLIGKTDLSSTNREVMNVSNSWTHAIEDSKPLYGAKLEEWECTEFLEETINRTSPKNSLGGRLFERFNLPPADYSAPEKNSLTNIDPVVQQQSGKIDSSKPIWDYKKEPWEENFSRAVWSSVESNNGKGHVTIGSQEVFPDPLKISFQSEITGTNISNWQNMFPHSYECSASDETWNKKKVEWTTQPLINPQLDPIIGSAHLSNVNRSINDIEEPDRRVSQSSLENESLGSTWPDLNDNISLNNNMANPIEEPGANFSLVTSEGEALGIENELCQSFKQLKLEQLWHKHSSPPKIYECPPMGEDVSLPSQLRYENRDMISLFESEDCDDNGGNKSSQVKGISENVFIHSIPSGPSGPCADLRHTESSGFKTVVPNSRNQEAGAKDYILVTPKQNKPEDDAKSDFAIAMPEEENLLTSPRTHFRPIRQDSHGSAQEDNKSEDSQGAVGGMPITYQNQDLIFQRTVSGNLFLEVDILEGSPKKYMAYREPEKIIPLASELSTMKEDSLSTSLYSDSSTTASPFVPKFKLVNNEKFCQTEQESPKNQINPEHSGIAPEKAGHELKFQNMLEGSVRYLWKADSPKEQQNMWQNNSALDRKEAWEMEFKTNDPLTKFSALLGENKSNWSHEGDFESSNKSSRGSSKFLPSLHSSIDLMEDEDKSSLSHMKFLWNKPQEDSSNKVYEQSNPWNLAPYSQTKETVLDISSKKSTESDEPQSRWQLQREVDQEADEILGELIPNFPLKASPTTEGCTNKIKIKLEKENELFDFLEEQAHLLPVEDLDNLEPDWDLNDGFEWDPTTKDDVDEEEGGQEVLVYETEDGQTIMVPVEYLDNNLYDQIFGCSDTPIGGSLPTLSQGQLEDWKSGKISYKLSRRSKGRFQPPSQRPCSYFLEGNCRRSDCKFSHDLSSITCRFWEEGSCLKGDTCPFLHGFDALPRRRNRSEGDQALGETLNFGKLKEKGSSGSSKGHPIPKGSKGMMACAGSFEIDSETDFPSLSSSLDSKTSLLEESLSSKPRVTKLSKKKQKYITVTKTLFKEISSKPEASKSSKANKKRSKNSKSGKAEVEEKCPESLRKILKKKHQHLPSKAYNHEDGTLSDF